MDYDFILRIHETNSKSNLLDNENKIIQDFQYNDELSEKYKREILDQDKIYD